MPKNGFVLTTRDQQILYELFRFKVMRMDDIRLSSFSEVHYSALTRRLRKLESMKLIERNVMLGDDKKFITIFSLKGQGLVKLKSMEKMISREQLKSNYIQHDLQLVRLLNSLKRLSMVSKMTTENELLGLEINHNDPRLKDFLELRPDAIATLTIKGHSFLSAIEYEHHQKSMSRWKDKLASYHLASSIDAVLYFCSTHSLMEKLISIDRECSKGLESKIFFACSDFTSDKLILSNSNGKELHVV